MSGFYKRNKFSNFKKNNDKIKDPKIFTKHKCLNSKELYPDLELFLQIAVFDPGTVSCGMRIVRYYLESGSIVPIAFHIIDFGNNYSEIVNNMENNLSDIKKHLTDCHHIIIEHQLLKQENVIRVFDSLVYYITKNISKEGLMPMLIEVDCKLKTTFIGGPTNKSSNNSDEMKDWIENVLGKEFVRGKVKIKEWTKMKSRKVSIERMDYISYNILKNSLFKENEDLSDSLCYEYAWIPYLIERPDIYIPFERYFLT